MRVSVIAPVLNEVEFIGYSVMAILPYVEEIIYAVSPASNDGTIELLRHIAKDYGQIGGKIRLLIDKRYDFNPMDMAAYNHSFNDCIEQVREGYVWFLHPDMIVTNAKIIPTLTAEPLAWVTRVTSYAGDLNTQITKGRATEWKNIHKKEFGLHYYGGYGSVNEDFYHSEITGKSYRHFGTDFNKYPFAVADSHIEVNHYCELKSYKRRLQKMKLCLKTQHPDYGDKQIEDLAIRHPRVTLEGSDFKFGRFEFEKTNKPIPEVFAKHKEEFEAFKKEPTHV